MSNCLIGTYLGFASISNSQGFDAPYFPNFDIAGGIVPYTIGKSTRDELTRYCQEALRIFNSENVSLLHFIFIFVLTLYLYMQF